jgi:hypothetical protein
LELLTRKTKELDHEKLVTVFLGPLSKRSTDLYKIKYAMIRVRTEEPDYSDLPEQDFDWAYSVYGNVREVECTDAPEPLGKYVTLTLLVALSPVSCTW